MTARFGGLCVIAALAALACRQPSLHSPALAQDAPIVADARAFMAAYARDLLAGDRAAVAARYDRSGTWLVREGQKSFVPYEAIVSRYASPRWSPPASFEWRDLSYDAVGNDAVVVLGHFVWAQQGSADPMSISYTALLQRQDGVLRIRVEDEKRIPVR